MLLFFFLVVFSLSDAYSEFVVCLLFCVVVYVLCLCVCLWISYGFVLQLS